MRIMNLAGIFCLATVFWSVPAWSANAPDQNTVDKKAEKVEAARGTPVKPVPSIDIDRYSGTWYDIAALPDRFHKNCAGDATTTYIIQPNREIRIENLCRTEGGGQQKAEGEVRLKGAGEANSKLEVCYAPGWLSWLPLACRDYWVIELDPDYRYAVVGAPDRDHLWILSRSPALDQQIYEMLVEKARAQGYGVDRLKRIQQQGAPAKGPTEQQEKK